MNSVKTLNACAMEKKLIAKFKHFTQKKMRFQLTAIDIELEGSQEICCKNALGATTMTTKTSVGHRVTTFESHKTKYLQQKGIDVEWNYAR